jgi:glycosyltransferase involved in cell wall biosynthesis
MNARVMEPRNYVLVSACRNEENYLDGLAECIAAQTVRPLQWIIVDDGSTDRTFECASGWAKKLPFLKVVRMPGGRPRSFASQVYAAQHGSEAAKALDYDFIGFLDADIRLAPDYYERLLRRFAEEPGLGLGGGVVIDQYADRTENIRQGSEEYHVAGGVQFFRRSSYEKIGGYVPIEGGGQDTIADIMTLMHGWKIQAFPDLPAMHLRPDGYAKDNVLTRGLKWGRKFYLLGYHPIFYFGQCLRRVGRRPVLVGSFCQLLGFVLANLKGGTRPVPNEFVRFLRKLQLERLRRSLVPGWTNK